MCMSNYMTNAALYSLFRAVAVRAEKHAAWVPEKHAAWVPEKHAA